MGKKTKRTKRAHRAKNVETKDVLKARSPSFRHALLKEINRLRGAMVPVHSAAQKSSRKVFDMGMIQKLALSVYSRAEKVKQSLLPNHKTKVRAPEDRHLGLDQDSLRPAPPKIKESDH